MFSNITFGTGTNLSLCVAVSSIGTYWLPKNTSHSYTKYRYLAYKWWWASWVAWTLAWTCILLKELFGTPGGLDLRFDLPIEIFDNLNGLCLILVYMAITRGRDYSTRLALTDGVRILATLGLILGTVYLVFVLGLAFVLHRVISLCIAVFTPLLVGWAFHLRFRTRVVVLVGLVYAVMQPVIYATELNFVQDESAKLAIEKLRIPVAMLLGFLKVAWAIVCTRVLSSGRATDRRLVDIATSATFKFWSKWKIPEAVHAVLLGLVYTGVLIAMVVAVDHDAAPITKLAEGIGIIVGLLVLLDLTWKAWEKVRPDGSTRDS